MEENQERKPIAENLLIRFFSTKKLDSTELIKCYLLCQDIEYCLRDNTKEDIKKLIQEIKNRRGYLSFYSSLIIEDEIIEKMLVHAFDLKQNL